mmetsp:Transcript_13692/g.22964  ORF Transcript_13692/g.22964 Transcript_13692/m.22964 type:complete len:86 (+) Transcript_13692:1807-2064(+)
MEQMKVALEACAEYQVAKLAMQKLKEESSKATASIAAAERRRGNHKGKSVNHHHYLHRHQIYKAQRHIYAICSYLNAINHVLEKN